MTQPSQAGMFDAMNCDPLELVERGSDVLREMHKWPQRLVEFVDLMRAYNIRAGMDEDRASTDAVDRVALIAGYLGGRAIYLPNDDTLRRALRDAQIFALQGKRDVEELARAFDLTPAQVYAVLAEQRALYVNRVQGRLFDDAGPPGNRVDQRSQQAARK
jgi:Mor family transcriptional regulator